MTRSLDRNLIQLQHHWLEPFGSDHCVDVRCHRLPGLDVPLAKLVATDAHDCASRGLCVTEVFDVIVWYRGKVLARQLFVEEPLALIGILDERQMERIEEGRALS